MIIRTIKNFRLIDLQIQQVRFGHRLRGKPPILCRTVQQRLDELNYKDELYTKKFDIGFCQKKSGKEIRRLKAIHLKSIKNDKVLENLARNHKLNIDLEETRNEWLKTIAPFHRKKIAEHYDIYEHLYGEGYFVPYLNLDIFYDLKNGSLLPVYTGNVIKPIEAQEKPRISYEANPDTLWTLTLINLDGHLQHHDKEYVHWFVSNIPGNNVENGETIVEYLKPFPLKGTGYHRYVFVLYKQDSSISYDIPKVSTSSSLDDRTFTTREWYKKYQDSITPAGLAFYQSDWDHSVKDFFHNVLKLKEPIYEYDFPAPYIKPQKWFPIREPFNLYMDKYRDPKQINKEYLLRKLKNEDPFKRPPPPLRFPNAHPFPRDMPSWLKLHEKKIRLSWGRVNDV